MTFDNVLEDIEKMKGEKLVSIKPGAEIIINSVNKEQGRIVLLTASGKLQSRPISELKTIWQKLHEQPAVHVDEALHGSGTSRNQPETIIANLPYIEWFKYSNKKHIALIAAHTHLLGTIKQMDEPSAEVLRNKIRGERNSFDNLTVIVVTDDISKSTRLFENFTGAAGSLVQSGIYIFKLSSQTVVIASSMHLSAIVPIGTYMVVKKPADFELHQQVQINGTNYCVKSINGLNFFIKM